MTILWNALGLCPCLQGFVEHLRGSVATFARNLVYLSEHCILVHVLIILTRSVHGATG